MMRPINPYWFLATTLAAWFLFVHSPPILLQAKLLERPLFLIHLIGAYVVYLACIHNTARIPWKSLESHVLVGRVGLVAGIIGFLGGLLYIALHWNEIDQSFAIGITIGGILQMKAQYDGYIAIREYRQVKGQIENDVLAELLSQAAAGNGYSYMRKEEIQKRSSERRTQLLRCHIHSMIALFVVACGMPAAMRLTDALGFHSPVATFAALGLLNVFQYFYQSHMTKHYLQQSKGKVL